VAITSTRRFGLLRWGAGSDPDLRAQHTNTIDKLEALAAQLLEGAFNARPAAGVGQRFYRCTSTVDGHFGELWADSGPVAAPGSPSWTLVNPPVHDTRPLVAMTVGG
jgi:hypothetical protein